MIKGKNAKASIYLLDAHPLFRKGLSLYINQTSTYQVCGEADNTDAFKKDFKKINPDILIFDISFKKGMSLNLIKDFTALKPELNILVLSGHDETLYAERSLQAGAKGYISKESSPAEVMAAIDKVAAGGIYLSPEMTEKMLKAKLNSGHHTDDETAMESLTDRELEVFQFIGEGKASSQIADELALSIKTVETYRSNIKKKFDLKNNTELIKHAVEWTEEGRE